MEEKLEDIILGALMEHFAPEDLGSKFDLLRERVNEAAATMTGVTQAELENEDLEDSPRVQFFYMTYSHLMAKVLVKAADKLTYCREIDG